MVVSTFQALPSRMPSRPLPREAAVSKVNQASVTRWLRCPGRGLHANQPGLQHVDDLYPALAGLDVPGSAQQVAPVAVRPEQGHGRRNILARQRGFELASQWQASSCAVMGMSSELAGVRTVAPLHDPKGQPAHTVRANPGNKSQGQTDRVTGHKGPSGQKARSHAPGLNARHPWAPPPAPTCHP